MMALRDYCAAGKMAMTNYHAVGKELVSAVLERRGDDRDEYENLLGIVREIKAIHMDLEWRHLQNERGGAVWLLFDKIKHLCVQADEVLDEFSYEAIKIRLKEEKEKKEIPDYCMKTKKVSIKPLSLHYPLLLRCKMSLKIKEFQHEIDDVKEKMKSFEKHDIGSGSGLGLSLTAGETKHAYADVEDEQVVKSRKIDNLNIVDKLTDPNNEEMLCVIVGAPVSVKISVEKLIFNHGSIRSHFDLRIWVDVFRSLDVKWMVREIIEKSHGSNVDDSTTWDNLLYMLEEALVGKRFLLVLDGMGRGVNKEIWDNVTTLLRVGSKGSKIIVTTPFKNFPSITGTIATYVPVGEWELFRGEAFGRRGGGEVSEELVHIGRELVKRCGDNPFALRTLGSMMHFKTSVLEWMDVLHTVSTLWSQSTDVEYSTLKFCYNDMEPPLRRCFSYCYSTFSGDSIIEKKKLIQLWMAEGLLEETEASSSISRNHGTGGAGGKDEEDIGNAYFKSLVLRSFLEVVRVDDNGEPLECKLERESDRFVMPNSPNDLHSFAKQKLSFSYRTHLCSSGDRYRSLLVKPWQFRNLRALELTHVSELELSFLNEDGLKQLRYLDLSHGQFKTLPNSLCKLYHLQTLKLLNCRLLQSLPKGMKKLINLRYLEIERTLLNIPRGLRRLSNLRTLTLFKVGRNNNVTKEEAAAAGIEELGCLQQLGGSLSLIGINNVKNGEAAKAAKLNEKSRLQELTLEWELESVVGENSKKQQDIVLEELQPHQNLSLLMILRFGGTKFPTWFNDTTNGTMTSSLHHHHLSNLRELIIYSCHHVKSLDMTGLRSLRKLRISHCENLEYAGIKGLTKLEHLELKGCDKLKSLVGENMAANHYQEEHQLHVVGSSRLEDPNNQPKLATLRIESCNNLILSPENVMSLLQSLETLNIENCANPMVLMEGSFENLSLLQDLQIESCPNLKELSKGVGQLKSLRRFRIGECPMLVLLSEEMQHWRWLQKLNIFGCPKLRGLPRGIAKLTSLEELEISGSDFLISIPDEMQELSSLKKLKIEQCSDLRALPDGLVNLSSLQNLEISSCNRLLSLTGSGMQVLRSLDTLKIKDCDNLEILPEELGNPESLRVLDIRGCPSLTLIPDGLGNLQTLSRLDITDCYNLKALPRTLGELSSLQSLYIRRCFNLTWFSDTLPHMKSLQVLWLIDCPNLKDISSGLQCLSSLEKLTIWGCHSLIQLLPHGIQDMERLVLLTISNCWKLEKLPDGLENLRSLRELVIWKCPKLKSSNNVIHLLRGKRTLRKLNIRGCRFLAPDMDYRYSFDPRYSMERSPF